MVVIRVLTQSLIDRSSQMAVFMEIISMTFEEEGLKAEDDEHETIVKCVSVC